MFINVQYVKDLSFENPRAPQSLIQPAVRPEVEINVDVKARNFGPETYEVVLTINVNANAQGEALFLVELAYAAVVTVRNASEQMLAGPSWSRRHGSCFRLPGRSSPTRPATAVFRR